MIYKKCAKKLINNRDFLAGKYACVVNSSKAKTETYTPAKSSLLFILKLNTVCYKKQQEKYPVNRLGALTKHHLRPRSKGCNGLPNNISHVPEKLHNAWHLLFLNHSPTKIAHIMNNHWIDSDYTMIAVHKDDIEAISDFLASRGLSKY